MAKKSLALAMIVKNEAENLPRLIESVGDSVDQIYITDTGSTDDTVEVATKLGAKVSHFKWVNDFAAARNFSFSQVKEDFVLWMDGDDILDDAKGLKAFRDDVMDLADYWVAKYLYSFDKQGNPTCEFVRERIMRMSKNPKWQYFVHEGVVPSPGSRTNYTPAFRIKHLRTEEDLKKDKSRNLNLFEANKDRLDGRMLYYYGKELFENGKHFDAAKVLGDLLSDKASGLEFHDRLIAIQYCAFSYVALNQLDHAINMAMTGIQLEPNRAEFYTTAADCYIKQQQFVKAVPMLSAAANCTNLTKATISPIFAHDQCYTDYPRVNLAKIYAMAGQLDKAKTLATEATKMNPHNQEAVTVLGEINRIQKTMDDIKTAEPCDDIVFSAGPVNAYLWDGEIYRQKAMGGSETACIEMAEELHKQSGRRVIVFNQRTEAKTFNGVEYIPFDECHKYFAKHKPWIHIAWRHNNKLTEAPTFVWSHDLQTPGVEHINNYTKVMCLTPFHKRYMMATQGVPEDKIYLTRNGLTPSKFEVIKGIEKVKNKFVFGSSPDRGLERAIRCLKEVRKEFPDVTLHVHYGIEHLPQWGHKELHDRLVKAFEENKEWLTYHGKTEQKELMKSYASAQYCLQPSSFIETSMVTCVELLSCGVYVILRKVGGAVDTISPYVEKGMASLIDSDCETDEEFQIYIDEAKKAIVEEKYKGVSLDPSTLSWEGVAASWLKDLEALRNQ